MTSHGPNGRLFRNGQDRIVIPNKCEGSKISPGVYPELRRRARIDKTMLSMLQEPSDVYLLT